MSSQKDNMDAYESILSKNLEDEEKAKEEVKKDNSDFEGWRKTKKTLFGIILFIFIGFNSWVMPSSSNLSAPLVIGLFELIFLLIISRPLGIPEISILIDKILESYGNSK